MGRIIRQIIARQKGNRRMGFPVEFSLEDDQGVIVVQDRRRLPDRRKAKDDYTGDVDSTLSKKAEDNLEELILLLQRRG